MIQAEQLTRVTWECVHLGHDEASQARDALEGGHPGVLELAIDSPGPLVSAIGKIFQTPDDFGGNWDSLDEC